jgi:3-deoxy-7-phosphoheptulonate synthase
MSPGALKRELPVTPRAKATVESTIAELRRIFDGKSKRWIALPGPCSVHSVEGMLAYAAHVPKWQQKYGDRLLIIPRGYVEKPRSGYDWTGLINDPYICGVKDFDAGRRMSRELYLAMAEKGVPVATEMLNKNHAKYIEDLVSYAAIGARSVYHQPLREAASDFPMPVGVKNDLEGNVDPAIAAIKEILPRQQEYDGIDDDGYPAMMTSQGNTYGHIILRGGRTPNYMPDAVRSAVDALRRKGARDRIVIDCSHGNSGKDYKKQGAVWRSVLMQMGGDSCIVGAMLESYHREDRQKWVFTPGTRARLERDISATDSCISIAETESLLDDMYAVHRSKYGS